MYEISCDMCMDLIPLVKDGVASPDSVAAVEGHIAGCEECREYYEGEEIPQTDGKKGLSTAIRRVKKISATIAGLLVLAGILLCERILQGSSLVFLLIVLLIWRFGRMAMEKEKRLIWRLAAFLFALALTAGLCAAGNALVGNPVSRMLAEKSVTSYLAGKFPEGGYAVEDVWFDAKQGDYGAVVRKEGSQDVRFTVETDKEGNICYDSYENVLTGWNTANRLCEEYRMRLEPVLEQMNLIYDRVYVSCDLEFELRQWKDDPYEFQYFLNGKALVPDELYDLEELGTLVGKVSIRVEDAEVSAKKAAQILLEIRRRMDGAGTPFRSIDLTLVYPRPENELEERKEGSIRIEGFTYEDIYEEGLEQRVYKANLENEEYYSHGQADS